MFFIFIMSDKKKIKELLEKDKQIFVNGFEQLYDNKLQVEKIIKEIIFRQEYDRVLFDKLSGPWQRDIIRDEKDKEMLELRMNYCADTRKQVTQRLKDVPVKLYYYKQKLLSILNGGSTPEKETKEIKEKENKVL